MGTLRALVSSPVIVYLASLIGGCAAYGSHPNSPAQGGSKWVEVSSPRFRVVSDLPPEEAEGVARELEQGVEAIEQVAFEHARSRLEPTTVIAFQSASDFHAFMPDRVDGRFYRRLPGDLEPSSVLVLYGSLDESSRITCLHELTHDLFDLNFGPAPPWLGEGWAQYFSTIELETDRIRVGAALPHLTFTQDAQAVMARAEDGSRVLAMPVDLVAPPSQLLGMQREAFYSSALKQSEEGTALYLGAWALVHLLHDGPEPYPTRFKRFMEAARHAPLQSAWESAFAGLSRAEFDHDFRVYLAKRELATFEYHRHAAGSALTVSKRALSEREVRLYWARLSEEGASDAQALSDLNAAITADASSPEARYFRGVYWLHEKQLAAAERDFLEAARVAPNEPRYLLGVLVIRIEQAQRSTSTHATIGDPVMLAAERLAPVAVSAMQLRVLALLYDDSGQLERALTFAQRAVARAPIDSWCLDAEARVLAHLGRTREALEIQRAAVAFVPESADAPEIARHLSELEAAAR